MRNVIIVGVHRGMSEVEPLDIKQEAGRAGRVGFDPEGDAHVLLPESKFSYYKRWCENIPPIKSTMNDPDILAFHIVSEIASKEVYDIKTLMEWYNRSLAAFQNDHLDRVDAEELMGKLEKLNIIEVENGLYKITQLGRIAANLYYSPYSIAGWYLNFKKVFEKDLDKDDSAIAYALGNIQEYNSFIPKEYQHMVQGFVRKCNLNGLSIIDGVAYMGFCFECCLTYSDAITTYDKQKAQFDMERIATALEMIDQQYARWGKGDYWKQLEMRVRYEVTWEQTELCKYKGIGGVRVRKLFDAGIRTINDFKKNQEAAVGVLGTKLYNQIVEDNRF